MPRLRSYLRRDGLLLAVSLLLAILIWKYVDDELTETRLVQARLELEVPPGLTVAGNLPATVTVELRGTRRRMAALEFNQVVARRALPPDVAGSVSLSLAEKDFLLPEGVVVADLPRPLTLQIERLAPKRVRVLPDITGQVAPGFEAAYEAVPREVVVLGRQEILEGLDRLLTEPVNVSGRREDLETDVGLQLPPGVHYDRPVKVVVRVRPKPVPRELTGVKVSLLVPSGFDLRARVESPPITLELLVEERVLPSLDPRSVEALADLSALAGKPGSYDLPVTVHLPPGVSLKPGFEPPKVRVRLEAAP